MFIIVFVPETSSAFIHRVEYGSSYKEYNSTTLPCILWSFPIAKLILWQSHEHWQSTSLVLDIAFFHKNHNRSLGFSHSLALYLFLAMNELPYAKYHLGIKFTVRIFSSSHGEKHHDPIRRSPCVCRAPLAFTMPVKFCRDLQIETVWRLRW